MSNIVRFLETLGGQPKLSAGDYAAAVALLQADEPQREALLAADADALNGLLGGRVRMVCMIAPSEEEAPERAPERENEDAPSEGESEKSLA